MTWSVHHIDFGIHPTTLATALLHCPGAHAFWSWWQISLIHLRPVEGYPPAKVLPGMTHEIVTLAIDPERCPVPDPKDWAAGYPHLLPIDVEQQFQAPDDATAVALFEWLCEEVSRGQLSPDQDYRRFWAAQIQAWLERRKAGAPP